MDEVDLDYEQLELVDNASDEDNVRTETRQVAKTADDQIDEEVAKKKFGIESSSIGQHLSVSRNEISALYQELGVDEEHNELQAVLVYGVGKMHDHHVLKIFADFHPEEIKQLDASVSAIRFESERDVAAMMLNMTKMIKRVRTRKTANEDGEVVSDDDEDFEEGQYVQEAGDDVEVVSDLVSTENGFVQELKDHVVINVNAQKIPDGKWRYVTRHVPNNKFLLVRFPTLEEFRVRIKYPQRQGERSETFWTHENNKRGGLNVFDKEGNELDWDYEHDTRFYKDSDKKEEAKEEPVSEELPKTEKFELPKGIKVRGRGAVKCGFLFGDNSSSLASDEKRETKRKIEEEKIEYEKDDVLSRVVPERAHEKKRSRITYN